MDKVKFFAFSQGNKRVFMLYPRDINDRKLSMFSTLAEPIIKLPDGSMLHPNAEGLFVHGWDFVAEHEVVQSWCFLLFTFCRLKYVQNHSNKTPLRLLSYVLLMSCVQSASDEAQCTEEMLQCFYTETSFTQSMPCVTV